MQVWCCLVRPLCLWPSWDLCDCGQEWPLSCQPMQVWSCLMRPLCLWPRVDHDAHCWLLSTNQTQRRLTMCPWSWPCVATPFMKWKIFVISVISFGHHHHHSSIWWFKMSRRNFVTSCCMLVSVKCTEKIIRKLCQKIAALLVWPFTWCCSPRTLLFFLNIIWCLQNKVTAVPKEVKSCDIANGYENKNNLLL